MERDHLQDILVQYDEFCRNWNWKNNVWITGAQDALVLGDGVMPVMSFEATRP